MDRTVPPVTVAIPTLNRVELLKRALGSAMAQTANVDIIVSDNGSTDGTAAYLDRLALPAHVRRYRHAPTMPVQQHGSFLVSQVRTEWVVFLSDDDELAPEFAARIVELIKERPDVSLVYTGCDLHFADVGVPAKVGPRFERASDFFFEFMDGKRNICMCATAFRVLDLRAIGPQPPERPDRRHVLLDARPCQRRHSRLRKRAPRRLFLLSARHAHRDQQQQGSRLDEGITGARKLHVREDPGRSNIQPDCGASEKGPLPVPRPNDIQSVRLERLARSKPGRTIQVACKIAAYHAR